MKIVSLDILVLRKSGNAGKTPVLCRVNTDEGISGYGEAGVSIGNFSLGCVPLLNNFGKMIVGMDPLDNDVIYRKLMKTFWARGNGGVIMAAVSAVDTALWDIKGKAFGVPVYVLLGGKQRDRLRAYASQLQYGWKDPAFVGAPGDLGFLKEACRRAVEEGYDCVKVDFLVKRLDGAPIGFDEGENHLTPGTMRELEAKLDAVRSVIGDGVELILENHCLTTANTAIQFGRLALPYKPSLLEEPANPFDILDYKRLRDALPIPLATGERSYTRRGVLQLLKEGVLDVLQPDLGNCGGITEGYKMASLAESFGVTVQAHTCNTPISVSAALQFEAALPNFFIHEHHTNNTLPVTREICVYDDQPVDGYFTVPDRPGIGNEPTEKVLAEAETITVKG